MTISTLGIIGSGQLGSLLCQAAKKLNIKTIVISDDENGPAQNYSGEFIYSQYDNKEKIKEFVSKVDIITYEFENIPVNILNEIDKEKKVLPKPEINKIIQNRKLEKTFVNNLGIKTQIIPINYLFHIHNFSIIITDASPPPIHNVTNPRFLFILSRA